MCLIVVKNSAESSFSVEDFKTSWSRNSDGTGIAYVEDGRIVVEKIMGTMKDQLALYYKHMARPQFILHQRLATHGEKSELNVHPFKVLSLDDGDPYDLIMAHNGILSMNKFSTTADKKYSDTQLFVLEYMQPLLRHSPELIDQLPFQVMLHDYIGGSNKLAFLRNDGRTWIFNKKAGDEHNGCWLSNKYSIEVAKSNNTYYSHTHGANSNGYHGRNNMSTMENYNTYEDGTYFREPWERANRIKTKSESTMSQMDADSIIEAIDEYAGMPVKAIESLIIDEPALSYDMINFLTVEAVNEGIMTTLKSEDLAIKLHDLLQEYGKKKAA